MGKISIAAIVIQLLLFPIEVIYSFNFSHPTLVSLEFNDIECIKPDVYRSGILLICAQHAVVEFNIQTGNYSLIAGQYRFDEQYYAEGEGSVARFRYVTDIVQKGRNSLIVSDSWNHCLRWVNSSQTSLLTGNCANPGFQDGDFNSAKFYIAWGLLMHSDNILFVSDTKFSRIRIVNLVTRMVSTLISGSNIQLPRHMVCLRPQCKDIYISFENGVTVYNGTSKTSELIAGGFFGDRGNSTGSLRDTRFFVPTGLALLKEDALFVADRLNYRIVLLNLSDSSRTSDVAIGEVDSIIHRTTGRFLSIEPQSLLCYNGSLYIGTNNDGLYKSEVTDIPDDFICYIPDNNTVTTVTTTNKPITTSTTAPAATSTTPSTAATTTTETATTTLLSSTTTMAPSTSSGAQTTPTTSTILTTITVTAKGVTTVPQTEPTFSQTEPTFSQTSTPASAAYLPDIHSLVVLAALFSTIFCLQYFVIIYLIR